MHEAKPLNSNFTCARWMKRMAEAARWAKERGAKYLMHWEAGDFAKWLSHSFFFGSWGALV